MNQLMVYDPVVSTKYLTHRFTEGLKREIRNVVLLQRPQNLESALAVACLQEEVLETADGNSGNSGKEQKKIEGGILHRPNTAFKGAYPLPAPPVRSGGSGVKFEDKRETEIKRGTNSVDKIGALKAQRCAQGLCYICAEKWSPTHKCANRVQLHAVQELFTVLFESEEDTGSVLDTAAEQQIMAISVHAMQGSEHRGSMRMLGQIQGKDILILVDSGSTASFISKKVAAGLVGVWWLPTKVQVKVADGALLHCQSVIQDCEWVSQGHMFCTEFKVLALGNYDVILGMDWLMQHSPMTVDWSTRTLMVNKDGQQILLQGIVSDTEQCTLISAC